ncbi:MAG: Tryptophan synthase alpha chain [Labilithrix sp.]|nr:Tryptophan synthase alpha chain [Labilithrix sp.]
MRRILLGACSLAAVGLAILTTPGCGDDNGDSEFDAGSSGTPGDGGCSGFACPPEDGGPKPGCIGLECKQLPCENGATTTVTGTVLDPAGKVPIYNATVYIPNEPLADIVEGASTCDRCDAKVSGKPIAIALTDTSGNFKLENVPIGEKIPLVIQIGKWRRQVEIPSVAKCAATPLDAQITRLPRNRNEGHIPRMALTTGGADPLQCLLHKIGIDNSEFGVAGSDARIHLYGGGGFTQGSFKAASSKFGASLNNGATFPAAQPLWSDTANLQKYDVVLLSCEGDENVATKPQPAKDALYNYAKLGGRVFASHYHYVWFSKSTDATVQTVANWAPLDGTAANFNERQPPVALPNNPATTAVNADISTAFPKAVAMNDWLTKQQALVSGKLPIYDARHNIDSVTTKSLSWITAQSANVAAPNDKPVQYMTFNTPIGAAEDAVCGRVVVSDIHVAAGQQGGVSDDPQAAFPDGCLTTDLSAQQKALEFMLFDLSSCIQKDDAPIEQPH